MSESWTPPSVEEIEAHRERLSTTVRRIAQWRGKQVSEYRDDPIAVRRSRRASVALRTLGNFVDGLSVDDKDVRNLWGVPLSPDGQSLRLEPDGLRLLSRFGLDIGAWQEGPPLESQMRNILRRANGIEQAARHTARIAAEASAAEKAATTGQ